MNADYLESVQDNLMRLQTLIVDSGIRLVRLAGSTRPEEVTEREELHRSLVMLERHADALRETLHSFFPVAASPPEPHIALLIESYKGTMAHHAQLIREYWEYNGVNKNKPVLFPNPVPAPVPPPRPRSVRSPVPSRSPSPPKPQLL